MNKEDVPTKADAGKKGPRTEDITPYKCASSFTTASDACATSSDACATSSDRCATAVKIMNTAILKTQCQANKLIR